MTSLSHFEKMLTYPAVSDVLSVADAQAPAAGAKKKVIEKKGRCAKKSNPKNKIKYS